jgi:hypothetical protein
MSCRCLFSADKIFGQVLVLYLVCLQYEMFFWFMRVPDRGREQRESNITVLSLLIIIILISYVIIYYYQIINCVEPSQPKLETELKMRCYWLIDI